MTLHDVAPLMAPLSVTVQPNIGSAMERSLQVERIANLGLAGRHQSIEESTAQIQQMNQVGVTTPSQLPFITPKPNHLITTADSIEVNSPRTVGEAEFVLFPTEETVFLGVGNDHKDGSLAATDMHLANSTCPSVVSDAVWALDDVVDHWDRLQLNSWVEQDGSFSQYQQATLDAFLPPETILDRVDAGLTTPIERTAIWSGTVGSSGVDAFPELVSAPRYRVQLSDPVLDRELVTEYRVEVADWITEITLD